jgi:hypothetical protein
MNDLIFMSVSAMDRIKGAQQHFGKGMTTGKMIIAGIAIIIVIMFIAILIAQIKKK